MSDFKTQPAAVATEEAEASGDTEAGSSTAARFEGSKSTSSFWSRAARLLRGVSPSSLREDLADALMTDADGNAAFSPEERAMLNNILRFREVRVEDVMVPRADIEAVDQNITIGELMVLFEESGRSRMPVYSEGLDDPRGMVHIRDLLAYVTKQARNRRRNGKAQATTTNGDKPERAPRQQKAGFDLSRVDLDKTVEEAGIVRQLLFVPPSMLASDLMQRMQAARIQMALVIDEYGGTDGLVSLEDIVEMVVGDIEDEHDDEEVMFARSSDDVFIADARVELEEIAEAVGPDFDVREQLEDVDTLGGLVFASLGRIPVRGEVVQAIPGFEFQILDADPRRVKRVRIMRKRPPSRRRLPKVEKEPLPDAFTTPGATGAGAQPPSSFE
ncbi:HlyC/CorC family transporter [Sinorhizobium meliloti WSM1022]|jgi:CBS domain containing-hemolysin-like protein|uniref:hemolysin family protein n=1 Tax=Rhizobium meliloti TaxID=382 RepID=UPI000419F7AD|nr:hemolysin family protein [Sinorhizobium meliloti]ASQ05229.1 HlyC/CorC family transporter [Sinorhizobium meliloti]MCM5687715.1 hemolysin family protein [Sinorhizobium meliloti]MCO6423282.1 hemolysin family protein [Sinorhizobium meliloti]MDE3811700.1 HlyC/CorC family transporter [Sinorhizobium meliloti]MDW9354208.1 CBS domain-containing protein [Sinorhizobium meliloti]